jgi:vacuolar-type H+-ATPase subunit H
MTDAAAALRAIRGLERETAQAIDRVRREQGEALTRASVEGEALIAAARGRGRETARNRFDAAVASAQQQAAAILEDGRRRAAALRASAEPYKETAVAAMVELLLAPPTERGK